MLAVSGQGPRVSGYGGRECRVRVLARSVTDRPAPPGGCVCPDNWP